MDKEELEYTIENLIWPRYIVRRSDSALDAAEQVLKRLRDAEGGLAEETRKRQALEQEKAMAQLGFGQATPIAMHLKTQNR